MSNNDNNDIEPKEIVEQIEKLPTKVIEIIIIVFLSFMFAIFLIDLIIIQWKDFSKKVLVVAIFCFIIIIVLLILSIIIRYWRAKNLIKTDKKRSGKIIALISIILSLILIILSQIENYLIENSLENSKIPCEPIINNYHYPYNYIIKNLYNSTIINKDIRRKLDSCPNGQDFIQKVRISDQILIKIAFGLLVNFSYILFGIFITILNRIKDGLDGPEKEKVFIVQNVEKLNFFRHNNEDKKTDNKLCIKDEEQNKNKYETMDSQERNLQ